MFWNRFIIIVIEHTCYNRIQILSIELLFHFYNILMYALWNTRNYLIRKHWGDITDILFFPKTLCSYYNITKMCYFSVPKPCFMQLDILHIKLMLIYAQHKSYLENKNRDSIWLLKPFFNQWDWFLIVELCKTINCIKMLIEENKLYGDLNWLSGTWSLSLSACQPYHD